VPTATFTPTVTATATPAQTTVELNTTVPINLRSGPATRFAVVGVFDLGTTALALGIDETGEWTEVRLSSGIQGWVRSQLVRVRSGAPLATATPSPTSDRPTATPTVILAQIISNQRVNIRSGPGTGFQRLGSLPPFTQVEVISRSDNQEWTNVRINGVEGWVLSSVLRRLPTATPAP
jgi:uncharacterized protein YraI